MQCCAGRKIGYVFFSNRELCWQHGAGRCGHRHVDEGEAPARIAVRVAAFPICYTSVHRGICVAGIGWEAIADDDAQHGCGVHAVRAGTAAVPAAASVLLFEPDGKGRRRMLPFLALGTGTTLYILWALTAYPLEVYVRGDSIVYI